MFTFSFSQIYVKDKQNNGKKYNMCSKMNKMDLEGKMLSLSLTIVSSDSGWIDLANWLIVWGN